ncbi:MAG: hypothetical protein JW703_03290 [Candidatus Diapherotrites archaeon]|nr:hypothetical protein [Candidatus Diapherotrites archaeon]
MNEVFMKKKRMRAAKTTLLNDVERKCLINKTAIGYVNSDLKEKYLCLDKTLKRFFYDSTLLLTNYKFLPDKNRLKESDLQDISKIEELSKKQFVLSFLDSFYNLDLKPELKEKVGREFIDSIWKKVQRTEDYVGKPATIELNVEELRKSFLKRSYRKHSPLLLKMLKLWRIYHNTEFLISKNKWLSAVMLLEDNRGKLKLNKTKKTELKEITVESADELIKKLTAFGLIQRIDNPLDVSLDDYTIKFSPLGFLVSLLAERQSKNELLLRFALEEVIKQVYSSQEDMSLTQLIRDSRRRTHKK